MEDFDDWILPSSATQANVGTAKRQGKPVVKSILKRPSTQVSGAERRNRSKFEELLTSIESEDIRPMEAPLHQDVISPCLSGLLNPAEASSD